MTVSKEHRLKMNTYFEKAKKRYVQLVSQFVADTQHVLDNAALKFDQMLLDMAYVDKSDHPLAIPYFEVCAELAVYLALKKYDVSVHDFGCALLINLAQSSVKPRNLADDPNSMAKLIACGDDSQKNPSCGEVVFKVFVADWESHEWVIHFKTCATCTIFSKHGAMDLVPYMCAKADILSDKGNLGLKRSGTIALGARECEYRYKYGGEPKRLAKEYPDRIRYVEKS